MMRDGLSVLDYDNLLSSTKLRDLIECLHSQVCFFSILDLISLFVSSFARLGAIQGTS